MRAQTMEEYREMIRQALLEVEDFRRLADEAEEPAACGFADALRRELEALQTAAAERALGAGGAGFAAALARCDVDALPFQHLLKRIARTCSEGLDASGAERARPEGGDHAS